MIYNSTAGVHQFYNGSTWRNISDLYAANAGFSTFAATSGFSTVASVAGVSTSVIGGIGSITSLSVSGITTTARLNVGTGGTVITTTAAGLVGIGTTNPRFALEVGAVGASGTSLLVNGNARITGILTIGTSSITLNGNTDTLTVPNLVVTNNTTGVIASGVAITVRDGGGNLGNASIIDFGDNLSVSLSAGIATITGSASGSSSQWVTTTSGIHTLSNVGIGTTNPTSTLTVGGATSTTTLYVTGVSTFAGITTVTGNTLFAKQVNVSGVSTFRNNVFVDNYLVVNQTSTNPSISVDVGGNSAISMYYDTSSTQSYLVSGNKNINIKVYSPQNVNIMSGDLNLASFNSNSAAQLYKGVTVTGTTQTDNLNVGTGITMNSGNTGVITATGGFASGVNTAATQIWVSGNRLIFNVVGIGSTSFALA
jgi:TM2 domain-containing membrane protein YozV